MRCASELELRRAATEECRVRFVSLWGIVALLACAWSGVARANPYLDQARKDYKELRFAEALEQLKIARQVPTGDRLEHIEILDLLARCQVAEGRAEAQATFAELLALEPGFELPRAVSPKIREVFDAAKTGLFAPDFAALEPLPAPPGEGRARLVDPWHKVVAVVLLTRGDDGEPWKETAVQPEAGVAIFPLTARGRHVSWYAEARAADGRPLASLASAAKPIKLEAVPEAALPRAEAAPAPRASGKTVAASLVTALAVAAVAGGAFMQASSLADVERANLEHDVVRAQQIHAGAFAEAAWATGFFIGSGLAAVGAVMLWVW
jgi:hypothetical protein